MWVGCDNHKHTPKEYQGDWYGEIRTISVRLKKIDILLIMTSIKRLDTKFMIIVVMEIN